tara:strand:+ start:174 stop:578 length:405 start_codon:yes stop_codon:yes gene_type:complete
MRKILSILIISMLFTSIANAKIIVLSKCFYTKNGNKFNSEIYKQNYYKVDTNKKTVAHIEVISDEWAKKNPSSSKVHIQKYDLDYYDNDFVVAFKKEGQRTYKYTLDLKKKIIEVYIVEKRKVLTYHKCLSNRL